jgi:hypothetical protein
MIAQVVVVGSGATAMTIVPALANAGINVTMLQRSPTYTSSFYIQIKVSFHTMLSATFFAAKTWTPWPISWAGFYPQNLRILALPVSFDLCSSFFFWCFGTMLAFLFSLAGTR